jgi:hypothetical protein
MDTKLWSQTTFLDKEIPNWPCPNCDNGILRLNQNKLFSEETPSSIFFRKESDFPIAAYHMTALLKCDKCKEYVSMVGRGEDTYLQGNDDDADYQFIEYKPKYFYPALWLFKIPKQCPKDIKRLVMDSFALYWSDLPACIGKIRVALERLMDYFKVNKTKSVNGKRSGKHLTLHQRIELFKSNKNGEVGTLLLALKWIGNDGAHDGSKLDKNIVLAYYDILQLALDKLFDTKESEIKKIAKAINKKKGI